MTETTTGGRSRTQRIGLEVLGWLLVVAGIAALVLPGPGLLLLALGLYVHSLHYQWAQKVLEPVKRAALRSAADSVKSWPRIAFSVLVALVVMGVGVVWGISPPPPSFWPIADKWWLIGGWGTGVVLIASGIVALGLIAWSMKQFRYGDRDVEAYINEHVSDDQH